MFASQLNQILKQQENNSRNWVQKFQKISTTGNAQVNIKLCYDLHIFAALIVYFKCMHIHVPYMLKVAFYFNF